MNRKPGDRQDRPGQWVLAGIGFMAIAVIFPDGFELVALGATVVVVLIWLVLLALYPDHREHGPHRR